ncbi:serine/threonine protein kinase [Nocardioides albertanoniae]|uniref:non-specific serine/threonine protein kinase n=1 Tax=Nocardioides albertanoniae TaxID=1175486 RepID=A0A543A2C3_9ACTN|nr:serine/threonine-protein kinase [Nocardioides albertanoniae]TQL66732.1 serine/threonine protein kinase [Nocardioides albertanoniae]
MTTTPNRELGPELPGMTCLGRLGSGGFADVYLYERHHPKVRVAVKLMRSSDIAESQRAQFAAEAGVMAELAEHPFIVPVHSAGETPDGRPYLVMGYYPNNDLGARVRNNPMKVQDALRFGIQMASAVETAHRAGIIHRDIKPSNILLSRYDVPGLADFGIAGRPRDDEGDIGVSLPWSPPEVLTSASNGSVASDVYSLSATVWHLLVGRSPFAERGNNSDRAVFSRILHTPPPATGRADVPPSLDRVLQQAMAKDPSYRPASVLDLARHFQRIEQELRLGRTEVQVLARESGGSESSPVVPAVPASPGEGPPTGSGRGNLPAAPSDPEAELVTEVKPPSQVIAQAPITQPPAALASTAGTETTSASADRTQFSYPRTDEGPAVLTGTRPQGSRSKTPAIIGVVILILVAAAIGIALSRGGEDEKPDKVPPPPVETDLPGVTGPAAPGKVKGTLKGNRAVFTWSGVPGATGYKWVADNSTAGKVGQPKAVVRLAGAAKVCIQVRSLGENGNVSQGAGQACVSK